MALNPYEARVLDAIGRELMHSDPALAQRLSSLIDPPRSPAREMVVIAVLVAQMLLGFLPLACGLALVSPLLVEIGMVTAFLATPVAMWATTSWAGRRFVRFDDDRSRRSP